MRIRVNSDEGAQYQVFQRLADSLVNERGVFPDPGAVLTYTLIGSSAQGTLYDQEMVSLGFSEQLLYTSNGTGDGDAFTVIYSVDPVKIKSAGNYVGRIIYTLRPVGGSSQEEGVLNLYISATGEFRVEHTVSSGAGALRLASEGPGMPGEYIRISYEGNMNRHLRVYQEIGELPVNDLNREISPSAMQFWVEGSSTGQSHVQEPAAFKRGKTLIYTSDADRDEIKIAFRLDSDAVAKEISGNYRGKINLSVETEDRVELMPVDLDVVVPPVFKMDVEFPEGGIRFESLLPHEGPQTSQAKITVKSNLGRPYMVSQIVGDKLTNKEGKKIEEKNFRFMLQPVEGSPGTVQHPEFFSVPIGEVPIFYSDRQGGSAEFFVIYQLIPSASMEGGDYATLIKYSLGEM
ncbi:MAG: hypothetical protein Q8Q08_09715 [Candidatus Omnitrophota bacterium]|nr:hypothetical protein [Candidatus Omnitrophota bacterium]